MLKLIKKPKALDALAESNSTFYSNISKGLVTPPIRLGAQSVAWPQHEIEAIISARIAGKSPEEVKQLVIELVANRQNIANYQTSRNCHVSEQMGGAQ